MSAPKMLSFMKQTPDFSRKFYDLFSQKSMVDVTLSADGQFLHAHKVVLAVASSWFEELFDTLKDKHPVIVVKDLTLDQLMHIIEFIYLGAVNIPEDEANTFKSTLESFRISLDDLENNEDFDEDEEDNYTEMEADERQETEADDRQDIESDDRQDIESDDQHENFNERLFELIENEENNTNNNNKDDIVPHEITKDVKIKLEPEWDEALVKEEPAKSENLVEQKMILPNLPATIQQNKQVTIKPSPIRLTHAKNISFATVSSPTIKIRTPACINEKLRLNDPITRTIKIVNTIPQIDQPYPSSSRTGLNILPKKTNIQELSKRLSKAILIRRVRKSDGSVVSERSPIKIVQGMRIQGSLPVTAHRSQPILDKQISIFRCSHCNKAFNVNKRRNAHEKFCFKNPSRPPSQCPFCPMVLCNPMYISTHIRKVHGIDENGRSIKS